MSAQSLVTSSQYPLIETGSFLTTSNGSISGTVVSSGNITFRQAFPAGSTPVVILQNTSGTTWDEIILGVYPPSNTSFTWTQTGTVAPEIFGVTYMAILVPNHTA
jgi:hypothetical protein